MSQHPSPEFVTDLLKQSGHLHQGQVSHVKAEPFAGKNSQNCRLHLVYSAKATGKRPRSIFQKQSPVGPFGLREIEYYTRIADPVKPGTIPHCYGYTHTAKDYTLWLEDLSESHQVADHITPTLDAYLPVVQALARLHSAWWQHPRLETVAELPTPSQIAAYTKTAKTGWFHFLQAADFLKLEERQRVQYLVHHHEKAMIERAMTGPMTLIHGDLNPGNILMAPDSTYLIDRQPFAWSLTAWLGVSDLAYMMVHWWDPEQRESLEKPLLKAYLEELHHLGVTDYGWDVLWQDYLLCVPQSLYTVLGWCSTAESCETFRWIWEPQLRKTLRALRFHFP